jgi:pimeloyl-ACP methyl ester carboxylesterase
MPRIQVECVTSEGDILYVEIRGQGAPLLMIPGGLGDGSSYSAVADRLSDEFKVITYDRRANARSSMNHPNSFDIRQESRDVVAVLRAAGETSAYVFGNSSGAVIALDLVAANPEAVTAVVAHEPPLARLHPDSAKWQSFFKRVVRLRRRFGRAAAMLKFSFGIGFDFDLAAAISAVRAARRTQRSSPVPYLDRRKTIDHFLCQELLPVTNYEPDLEALRRTSERVALAAGRGSLAKKRFYAEVAPILARRIGCELVEFPGYHASFALMPDAFSTALRATLRKWTH